ncbi:MAG TPA: glutamine--fructose-6-phosphate transaminase (isomerizing) [Candidatus Faecisoma merdavium]|nr:glutamine--fructose-6-phosphate transaminase (isomerizing) [Candidatus Faecisoma merdavium]
MCGIYCYVGKKKAIPILLEGLSNLEYRGYDSAGIAYVTDKINIIKEKGRLDNLKKILNLDTNTYLGIGHTRWATHGKPNKKNAHPHHQGKVTLVHNGIIENYQELKLLLKDYRFKSETDTEVLCCLIDKLLKENNDILKVLSKLKEIIKGSYALGIILDDDLNNIYGIKKNSPLILAKSNIGNFLASDIPAILKYTNNYILLDDDDIVKLNKNEVIIYDSNLNILDKKVNTFDGDINKISKGNYEHFMLKEIFEQPDVLYKTYLENQNLPDLKKYNKIHIVGCGSAYHAGLIGKYYIEKYCNIEVNVEVASEYRYKNNFIDKNTLVIFISQSGETADTLACVKKVKDKCDTLGIINVIDSSIAREVKNVIYTKAGCEIAVATTKAYSCQILILMMMALKKDITSLISKINDLLKNNYEELAKKIYKSEHLFYIGRGLDYYLALEGALKLKEISYINSVSYPAGELKHGTISLIEKNTIVIAIATDKDLVEKTISNIKEVKARGAYVIYITTNNLNQESDFYDDKIVIEKDLYQPLLTIIPIQLIAYHVAKLRKCDIDKPKNLAKSVTVE